MTSNNNEEFTQNNAEVESGGEKLVQPESLELKTENYLSKLKQLKDVSETDTQEALAMITSAETSLVSSLPEERAVATEEIRKLDEQKNNLLVSSEKSFQEGQSGAVEAGSSWSNIEQPDANLRDTLRQEKESLKLRELKTLAAVAYSKIRDHAASLGVEISGAPEDIITFKGRDSKNLGVYSTDSDDIKVESNSAKVIIHEELHFVGAVDNRSGEKNLGNNRISKTGFKSVWKSPEAEGKDKDLLRSLNEAVTEKMAREIFKQNKESIIDDVIKADPDIAQLNDKLAEQEKTLALADTERYLPDKYRAYTENVFIQEYDMERQSFEDLAAEEKNKIESKFQADLFNARSQSILKESDSYNSEIRVLDAMLDKLSQVRARQNDISLEVARNEEWRDMQKAYLKGETIYLRRIEKIVGPNFLREFNEVDVRKVKSEEESQEDYQKKINNLIERINA